MDSRLATRDSRQLLIRDERHLTRILSSMTQLFDVDSKSQTWSGFARVALEQGIDAAPDGLTYAIPQSLAGLHVGDRVIVPLGRSNRPTAGYITAITSRSDVERVKPISSHDPYRISLTPDLIELARWIASYYCCPLGMVLTTMLPAAVKRGTGTVRQLYVCRAAPSAMESVKLTKLQRAVLDASGALADEGQKWIQIKRLADRAGARTVTPVKQLITKGVLVEREQESVRADAFDATGAADSAGPRIDLSAAQQSALDSLAASLGGGFSVHLIHGVTGSGKTEVYLRLIEQVQGVQGPQSGVRSRKSSGAGRDGERGKSAAGAIVLVPEIALTPQTVARFRCRFEGVAVLHSGLTAAQRHEQWRRIRDGKARIVVGARSAIFAPLDPVDVIIIDEEHDQSYKQDQLPRYQARDVAVKRAQILGVPVVLGSATPSLESRYNAAVRGTYRLHRLPDRVTGFKLPKVQIIDMVAERRRRRGIHLISGRLEELLLHTLRHKNQAMLLLNRRGFANYIGCPDHGCGWLKGCDYCDATMVYHKDQRLPTGGLVRCHHCAAEQILPRFCPVCSKKVTLFGLGTQRVEEELGRKFGDARVRRMDSDTMRTGRDYHATLEAFRDGEIDVLVGTQMIAKGLDFPNVWLVGVISADTALHLPDFRAAERTFQLIAQVAGRAGRGDKPGIVVVQTFSPEDAVIGLASRYDYDTFADREIELRRKVGLPPVTRMARIVVRHTNHATCYEQASKLAGHLEAFNHDLGEKVRIRGPMPCPLARIAGFFRNQIELIAPDASALQKLMTALRNARLLHADSHTAVDVDPVSLM